MEPFRLVFTATNTPLGWLIRRVTRSTVSHVMLEYSSVVWGGRWIAEAHAAGVRKLPAKSRRHGVVIEYEFKHDISAGLRKVRHLVGAWYDVGGLFRIAYVTIMLRWFRVKVRHPMSSTRAQMCSEFIARILKRAQYPGTSDLYTELVTPEWLLRYCRRHPELFRKVSDAS